MIWDQYAVLPDGVSRVSELDLKWFYKPVGMLETNFAAIIDEKPYEIFFADTHGLIFDKMTFAEGTCLRDELIRNGFIEANKDDDFFQTCTALPDYICDTGRLTHPVYSSGKFWIDEIIDVDQDNIQTEVK